MAVQAEALHSMGQIQQALAAEISKVQHGKLSDKPLYAAGAGKRAWIDDRSRLDHLAGAKAAFRGLTMR